MSDSPQSPRTSIVRRLASRVQNQHAKQAEPHEKRSSNYLRIAVGIGGAAAGYSIWTWPTAIAAFLTTASPAIMGLATLAIAGFTYTLWRTTDRTLTHLEREFIATHRPKLTVRSFAFINVRGDDPSGTNFFNFAIKYRIVNVGQSNATIIAVGYGHSTATTGDPFPPNPLAVDDPPLIPPETVAVGKSLLQEYERADPAVWMAGVDPAIAKTSDLRFFGRLVYLDDSGMRRETGFCRCYNFASQRFTIVDDADYEYTD